MLVNRLVSYEKTENGWLLHADTADALLVFLTDDIVRIRVNFDRSFDEASYTLVTTAWADRLDPLFEGERRRVCALYQSAYFLLAILRIQGRNAL